MSWGDSPTELFNDINDLEAIGALDEVGFNNVIDYKAIVKKILKQKTILPMLMSLDKDFDSLISRALGSS